MQVHKYTKICNWSSKSLEWQMSKRKSLGKKDCFTIVKQKTMTSICESVLTWNNNNKNNNDYLKNTSKTVLHSVHKGSK